MPVHQAAVTVPEMVLVAALLLFYLAGDHLLDGPVRLLVRLRSRDSGARQRRAREESEGLTLYYRPTCPFCIRTLATVLRLGVPLRLRNIRREEGARQALVRHGGRQQVPCLHVPDLVENGEEHGEWRYESADISRWLRDRFNASGTP